MTDDTDAASAGATDGPGSGAGAGTGNGDAPGADADRRPHRGADPFGRAIRDFHRDELDGPLVQRDGPETATHPIERFYRRSRPSASGLDPEGEGRKLG